MNDELQGAQPNVERFDDLAMSESVKNALQHQLKLSVESFETPILEFSSAIQSQLEEMVLPLQESIERSMKEAEAASEEIGPFLRKAGFWIPPSAPATLIMEIRKSISNGDSGAIEVRDIFVERYRSNEYELLKAMVDYCVDHAYFHDRSQVLKAAMRAHMNSDYVLSIPALLPILEGTLRLHLGRNFGGSAAMAEQAANDAYIDMMRAATSDALIEYVTGVGVYGSTDPGHFHPGDFERWLVSQGYEPSQVINRHAILHGVQVNYASEENSLRAFFLLDTLTLIDA